MLIWNNYLIKIFLVVIITSFSFYFVSAQFNSGQIPAQQKNEIEDYKSLAEKYKNNYNPNEAANYYNKIAYIYWMNGISDKAIEFFTKSLEQNLIINNMNGIKSIYTNIAGIYSDEEEYDKALNYFEKSQKIRRQQGNKKEIAAGLLNIAITYAEMQELETSNKKLEEALSIAQEENDFKLMRTCYGLLSENYEKLGDAEKSLEYFNFYTSFEKRVQREQLNKKRKKTKEEIATLKSRTIKAEAEKEAKEKKLEETEGFLKEVEETSREQQIMIDLLNKGKELDQARIKMFRRSIYSAAGGVILLIFIAIVLYRGYKHKQKANAKLEAQNKEILEQQQEINRKSLNITNSINYAQRIQQAMLPQEGNFINFLEESFILLKPRDIVSGDFYWFSDMNLSSVISNAQNGNEPKKKKEQETSKFIVSAIDCTGHGVPGAFMSMIGFNLINEIISQGITMPDEILNVLHKGIRNALKQDTTENRDGMDMAMCVVDKNKGIIEFAGAKNPLVYVVDDELFQVKGDKSSIGGFQREGVDRKFTKHTIKVERPTCFYIYSDGYPDQIGGSEGNKFLSKNFKKLLVEINREPMNIQKQILEETFEKWKGNKYKQVDDILVIGFKC